MKTQSIVLTIGLSAALIGFTGCKKEESGTPGDSTNTTSMTSEIKEGASNAVEGAKDAGVAVKDAAVKAGTEIKDKVSGTTDASSAQNIIDKAKALVADSKYQEALTTLQGLSDFKLTDDQQKTVDDLKAQIQKALSGTSVGNMK